MELSISFFESAESHCLTEPGVIFASRIVESNEDKYRSVLISFCFDSNFLIRYLTVLFLKTIEQTCPPHIGSSAKAALIAAILDTGKSYKS